MADGNFPAPNTTTNYIQPQYYTDTAASVAGGVQGMLGNEGYLNQAMGNWYSAAPGQGALGQYAQYNPNNMQTFANPYVGNVVDEQARLSNQNLFENVLPNVNSTFTGAGQFGSTRNADFTNRAIRDQGYNLAGVQGATLMGAQDAANRQYQDWTKLGIDASQQDFSNWLQRANFPIGALSQLGQTTSNIRPSQPLATQVESGGLTEMQRIMLALKAADTGLDQGGGLDSLLTAILGNSGQGDPYAY